MPCKDLSCSGCTRPDCGVCKFCLDKRKFGGLGKQKKRCQRRQCNNQQVRLDGETFLKTSLITATSPKLSSTTATPLKTGLMIDTSRNVGALTATYRKAGLIAATSLKTGKATATSFNRSLATPFMVDTSTAISFKTGTFTATPVMAGTTLATSGANTSFKSDTTTPTSFKTGKVIGTVPGTYFKVDMTTATMSATSLGAGMTTPALPATSFRGGITTSIVPSTSFRGGMTTATVPATSFVGVLTAATLPETSLKADTTASTSLEVSATAASQNIYTTSQSSCKETKLEVTPLKVTTPMVTWLKASTPSVVSKKLSKTEVTLQNSDIVRVITAQPVSPVLNPVEPSQTTERLLSSTTDKKRRLSSKTEDSPTIKNFIQAEGLLDESYKVEQTPVTPSLCHLCRTHIDGDLLHCSMCCQPFHQSCLSHTDSNSVCEQCLGKGDQSMMSVDYICDEIMKSEYEETSFQPQENIDTREMILQFDEEAVVPCVMPSSEAGYVYDKDIDAFLDAL